MTRRAAAAAVATATVLAACAGGPSGAGPAGSSASPGAPAGSSSRGGLSAATTPGARTTAAAPTTTGGPALPAPVEAQVGTVRRGIAYAGTSSPEQRLDVHLPPGATAAPVVVFVHGGGWFLGSRALIDGAGYGPDAPVTRDLLLRAGYALVSVDYRRSGTARFPAQIDDLRTALAYLRAHARQLGLDASRTAVFGESAGGHLALLAGERLPGIRAVVGYYPVTDVRTLDADRAAAGCSFRPSTQAETMLLGVDPSTPAGRAKGTEASPIAHVHPGLPPTLLVHGTRDCTVPYAQSRRMVAALRAAGVPATLVALDADHADSVFWTSPVAHERLLAFLHAHL